MKLKFIPILLSALTLSSTHAEEYILAKKGFMPAAGTTYITEETSGMKDGTITITQPDGVMKGTTKSQKKSTSSHKFINNKIIIFTVTAHEDKITGTMNGQPTPENNVPNPLLNKPLILELKDNKWNVKNIEKFEGKAKEKALNQALEVEANLNTSIYGFEPREVGDEWKADEDALTALLGHSEGMEKVEGSIKLISVEKREEIMVAKLEVTIKASGTLENGLKMGMEGPMMITRDLKNFIDLEATGVLDMSATGEQGPMKLSMESKLEIKETITIKEAVAK